MKVRIFILVLSVIVFKIAVAQDFHYAQFDVNTLYLNPALTGERLTDEKGIKFNVNYRDQLSRFTRGAASYKSVALGFDKVINKKFAIGQFLANNKSVDGGFNTFNLMLSGSYNVIDKSIDNYELHNLTVGLQVGILNKSTNPDKFTYDSQYSPNGEQSFDTNLPNYEVYERQSFFKMDVNFGVYYRTSFLNNKLKAFSGLSVYHITKPNESFISQQSRWPMKFNFHAGAIYKFNEELSFMPQILYVNQAKAYELNIGTLVYYKIKETLYEPIIGLNWRYKNAIIPQIGLRYKGITYRMSYCAVTNYLSEFKNRGLEFSLTYVLK